MAIEHVDITTGEIHEPKGASSASAGQIYIADGAASGSWRYIPHASCYYDNIGTGTTITGPTTYTLIGPATTGDSLPRDFTHNSLCRLTYTGTTSIDANIDAIISFKHSTGSGQNCFFQIHKNGVAVAGAQQVVTADSANYQNASILSHIDLVTNDYVEVFCKTSTGNIIIHSITFKAGGHI
jgi:hypothetical protein